MIGLAPVPREPALFALAPPTIWIVIAVYHDDCSEEHVAVARVAAWHEQDACAFLEDRLLEEAFEVAAAEVRAAWRTTRRIRRLWISELVAISMDELNAGEIQGSAVAAARTHSRRVALERRVWRSDALIRARCRCDGSASVTLDHSCWLVRTPDGGLKGCAIGALYFARYQDTPCDQTDVIDWAIESTGSGAYVQGFDAGFHGFTPVADPMPTTHWATPTGRSLVSSSTPRCLPPGALCPARIGAADSGV